MILFDVLCPLTVASTYVYFYLNEDIQHQALDQNCL